MIKINWTWTLLLIGSLSIAVLSCYRIEDPGTLLTYFISQVFVYGICLWLTCWIVRKLYNVYKPHSVTRVTEQEVDDGRQERLRIQQERIRQSLQEKHNQKSDDFRRRVIEPREDVRRQKQDEELYRVTGGVFQGQGHESGYVEGRPQEQSSDRDTVDNVDARDKRRLPEQVTSQPHRLEITKSNVKKREIKLPDEPDYSDDNVVTVVLRTPLDQKYSRRFLSDCKLQIILDYMTTLGYSQSLYTLYVPYPRQPLTDMEDRSLEELNFDKRIILHIAEID
ncbi:ubiquitin-dependent ERAD pathway [Mactra antiquata]